VFIGVDVNRLKALVNKMSLCFYSKKHLEKVIVHTGRPRALTAKFLAKSCEIPERFTENDNSIFFFGISQIP
jgi:hypothetical protein